MVVVGSDWEWSDTLPPGLDQADAKVYRQKVSEGRVHLDGEHVLFEDGQVWWRRDGQWRRSVIPAGDLDGPLFELVTT
jgi:hypothetical protein